MSKNENKPSAKALQLFKHTKVNFFFLYAVLAAMLKNGDWKTLAKNSVSL